MKLPDNSHEMKDPVCGMTVPPDSPHRLVHQGREYLFCSKHCLDNFQQHPEHYISTARIHKRRRLRQRNQASFEPPAETDEVTSPDFLTCSMHPEVQEPVPRCPKCGMFLQRPEKTSCQTEPQRKRETLLQPEFTSPAPCIRRCGNLNPVPARSAAWPWNRQNRQRL